MEILTTKEEFSTIEEGSEVIVTLNIELKNNQKTVSGPVLENNKEEEIRINEVDKQIDTTIKYSQIKFIELFNLGK